MRYRSIALCTALSLLVLLTAGCAGSPGGSDSPAETMPAYEEVTAAMGQSASYGGMTMTLLSVEDPDILMQSGKKALFFKVIVENGSGETVDANYLNNFTITVDGRYYEADECCTIPVMRELYDFYGESAMAEHLEAGASCTGYIACEVERNFSELELHYTPKTTDRVSRITVPITSGDVTKASRS